MKIFKSILLVVAVFTAFLSCQKEVGFENAGVSAGTLSKDAAGDCLPVTVNGVFKVDSVLTNANFVDVKVNVTTPGNFEVRSDTVNGYSFRKVGSVVFGPNIIRLYASGKPVASGTNTFTIRYGGSTCTFDVTVAGPGVVPAVFTLGGSPSVCTGAIPGGTYTVGTALTPSNTLVIEVNVTTAGTYVIAAATTSGFTFGASGLFAATGLQNVTLTGTGTPTTAGIATVTVTNVASTCTFDITVQPAAPPAVFTLDGAPNGCTNFTVNGTYAVNVATTASNTVTLNVTVASVGTYTISTNTASGITFSKSGIFTATGSQPITLLASGTPTTAGATVFTPSVGTNNCTFSVTVQPPPPPATFTLSGASGVCTPATVNGTYTALSTLGATHTAIVQVNVLTTGTYTLSTNTVNGITFSKSGTFTATGLQSVTLQGSGTPLAAGTSTLTPQIGTSSCTFDVVVAAAPTGIYTCKIDGVFKSFNDRAVAETATFGTPNLYLDGYTGPPNGGFVPEFQIFIDKNDASPITVGTYNEKSYLLPNGHHIEIDYKDDATGTVIIWNTSSTLFPPANPAFTIIVTSITATRVKGTFSGTLTNTLQGSTLFKTVTEGVFDLPIQ